MSRGGAKDLMKHAGGTQDAPPPPPEVMAAWGAAPARCAWMLSNSESKQDGKPVSQESAGCRRPAINAHAIAKRARPACRPLERVNHRACSVAQTC